MDFNNQTIIELFIKNIFTILSADTGIRVLNKKSFLNSAKELALSRDLLTKWFNEWKQNPNELLLFNQNGNSTNTDREIFFYICSALLFDEAIPGEILERLSSFAVKCGVSKNIVHSIFANKIEYASEPSFIKRGKMLLVAHTSNGSAIKITPIKGRVKQVESKRFYVANHITTEGLDELQCLILAYRLGCHAALDGPPGVGKTHCVTEVADILGLTLYTKTCSSRTTESHIISYPVLGVQNGASITEHINGPLVNAMIEPGIFYGDEFNLLKEDVQKRMNSAFDERRYIDRNDGQQISAKPGFWAVISYNPSQQLATRDLDNSVADRFVHYHFSRWSAAFKAYVAHRKACNDINQKEVSEKDFGINLSWRGISEGGEFFVLKEENGEQKWHHFFTGKPSPKPSYIYQVHDTSSIFRIGHPATSSLAELERNALKELMFAQLLSQFTDTVHTLAKNGRSPMLKKIGLGDILEEEDLELLALHESSTRIEVAALKHYQYLVEQGFNRYLAQSYAVNLVINQICYGQYREKKLRNHSVHELLKTIATSMRLLADFSRYNTNLTEKKAIKP